jgi:hypothetical protein
MRKEVREGSRMGRQDGLDHGFLLSHSVFPVTDQQPTSHPRQRLDWSVWEFRFIEHLLCTRHCAHVITMFRQIFIEYFLCSRWQALVCMYISHFATM